jgi:pyruvate kinase
LGRHVAVLQDLAGHRIRTGPLQGRRPVVLKAGQMLTLCRKPQMGTGRRVSIDYLGSYEKIGFGQMIYIEDGKIHLQVIERTRDELETVVIQEGRLGERKGVNLPGAELEFPPLSQKDLQDLSFAIDNRIDYVAQSFVRSAQDVQEIRKRLHARTPRTRIIAKIESPEGVRNFEPILKASNGAMVARGDLGLTLPIHEIPILQKWMIATCNHRRKLIVTATQMLESMISARVPTRAEVTDVANAVIDGTDFVMLSGETAMGRYPVEAVQMMRTIIEYTEKHVPYRSTEGWALSCPRFATPDSDAGGA